MRRILIACACVMICIPSCMVGPDYKRPAIDVPQSFLYMPEGSADISATEWWKQFNDPVMDQLITEALGHNKSLEIAAANVEQAAGFLMTTRSDLFPQINYSASASRQFLSPNSVSFPLSKNPFNNFQVLAGASWEIDLWGRIRRLTESARAALLASEEARRGVVLSLVTEVANSYIQLRALDEQLLIAQRSLKTYGESVKLFELQNKHGQVSMMTVQEARSQYETAAATIPQIEARITLTENALCILLGRNPGHIARGKTLVGLSLPAVPAGLPSQLLQRRPDIMQAEQNLIAANAQIGAARSLYFPTISLTGDRGASSEQLSDLFHGPSRTWSYAGSITGPIFTGGRIRGLVKQAEGGRNAALAAYELAIQSAFADTENALYSSRKLMDQLSAEQRRVHAYREYVRLARLQYNGGYAPYMTVLYAESQLFPAELNAVQIHAANFIAIANLYKAMGGGWIDKADDMTASKPDASTPFIP